MIERAVSTSVRCSPTARAPRVVTAVSEPIAASEMATTESASSTSIKVKPRSRCPEPFRRNTFYSSREPVDPDLVADAKPRQRDGPAARHTGCEDLNGRIGRPLIAAGRKQRVKSDIVGYLNDTAGRARADHTQRRVHLGRDLRTVADRG